MRLLSKVALLISFAAGPHLHAEGQYTVDHSDKNKIKFPPKPVMMHYDDFVGLDSKRKISQKGFAPPIRTTLDGRIGINFRDDDSTMLHQIYLLGPEKLTNHIYSKDQQLKGNSLVIDTATAAQENFHSEKNH